MAAVKSGVVADCFEFVFDVVVASENGVASFVVRVAFDVAAVVNAVVVVGRSIIANQNVL